MKSGVYLFIGCIVSVLVIKTNEQAYGDCGPWGQSDHKKYYCGKSGAALERGPLILPDSIPSDIEVLYLLKGESLIQIPWLINSVNYFQRYPELHTLSIGGLVEFSRELFDTKNKSRDLQKKLFDLTKLRDFECIECRFNSSNHVWKIPWEITRLVLANNSYENYTFPYSPYLKEINLEWNNLTKMPQWHDKASPVKELYLYGNPRLLITFDEIVKYCHLTQMSFDVDDSPITKSDHNCDCFRIKKWIKEFEIKLVIGSADFKGERMLVLNCSKSTICERHKTEEFLNYKEICVTQRKLKENPPKSKHKPPFKPSKKLLNSVFVLIFVTFCLVASALLLFAKHKSRRKRKKHKKKAEDGH